MGVKEKHHAVPAATTRPIPATANARPIPATANAAATRHAIPATANAAAARHANEQHARRPRWTSRRPRWTPRQDEEDEGRMPRWQEAQEEVNEWLCSTSIVRRNCEAQVLQCNIMLAKSLVIRSAALRADRVNQIPNKAPRPTKKKKKKKKKKKPQTQKKKKKKKKKKK